MDGWISVYRRIQEKSWYKDSNYVHVWLHLILNANHCKKNIWVNGKEIVLERGQLLTSRGSISKNTGVEQSKCYRILKRYESEQQIEQQTFNKYTIITIKNYGMYQRSEQQNEQVLEQQMNNKRTTDEQQMNTNNNVNNINNVNKRNKKENIKEKNIFGIMNNVLLSDDELEKLKLKFNDYEKRIDDLSLYISSSKKKYASHYATLLAWSRKEKSNTNPEWFEKQVEKEKLNSKEESELDGLLSQFK